MTWRFFLFIAGRRKAFAVLQRSPLFWVNWPTWKPVWDFDNFGECTVWYYIILLLSLYCNTDNSNYLPAAPHCDHWHHNLFLLQHQPPPVLLENSLHGLLSMGQSFHGMLQYNFILYHLLLKGHHNQVVRFSRLPACLLNHPHSICI